MVGVGTVVDAAIGWLVESILGNFLGGSLEAWIRGVGLAEDVEELKAAVRSVQMVVAAAKGRKIENKPLARSLDDLKELLYDADDVMDELDYYRLKLQVESDNCRSGTPDAAMNTETKSKWLFSPICQLCAGPPFPHLCAGRSSPFHPHRPLPPIPLRVARLRHSSLSPPNSLARCGRGLPRHR
ncbi:unnamed protein product [Urochloa humidicola]